MAIEPGKRNILVAALALLVVGAGAGWIFLVKAPPSRTVVKAPSQPAAAKPAAVADKAETPAPSAQPAPDAAAKPEPAQPIPADPDRLIAEILEVSGQREQLQSFRKDPAMARHFDTDQMAREIAANLRKNFDGERMGQFLQLLRQPIMRKMTALESADLPDARKQERLEEVRRRPPTSGREKLVYAIDELTGTSETSAAMSTIAARAGLQQLLARSGRPVTEAMRGRVDAEITRLEKQSRQNTRDSLVVAYRDASDEELAEYVRLLGTDIGRWGSRRLVEAIRPVVTVRAVAMASDTVRGSPPPSPAEKPRDSSAAAPKAPAAAAPSRPECVFKPVMTEADMAACR